MKKNHRIKERAPNWRVFLVDRICRGLDSPSDLGIVSYVVPDLRNRKTRPLSLRGGDFC